MRYLGLGLLLLLAGCYNGYSAYPYYAYPNPGPGYYGYGAPPPPPYYQAPPPGYAAAPPPGYAAGPAANDSNNCGTPDQYKPCYGGR